MTVFNGFTEKRDRNQSTHTHEHNLLKDQRPSVVSFQEKGYTLWFVRKLSKECHLAVLYLTTNKDKVICVYHDGEIDYNPKLKFRETT